MEYCNLCRGQFETYEELIVHYIESGIIKCTTCNVDN